MSVAQVYTRPTPIRSLGSLLLPPIGVGRRMLSVCQAAFMDAAEALRRSREADAVHDVELRTNRLICQRGASRARAQGCGCELYFLAADRRGERAEIADADEDGFIGTALSICRRLTAAIEKLFSARRRSTGGAR